MPKRKPSAASALESAAALPRSFYDRDSVAVARDLLGTILIRVAPEGLAAGRIVETEAYSPIGDSASHAFRGQTRRNASMFGPPGHAYVYAIHSRWCFNVVTEPPSVASAALVRALEPLHGTELMAQRRGTEILRNLARGPARLCEALAINKALDGWDLTLADQLWIARGEPPTADRILTDRRIGVTSAHDLPLRFLLADCPFVSRPVSRR